MTLAAALSAVAACLELLVGALCLGFARAPGWGRLRAFAFLAFTAAAYSLSNLPQTLTADPRWIVPASQVSLSAGALQALGWLRYSAGHDPQRPVGGRPQRLLAALLGLFSALALVPGALARPTVHATDLPALGLRYHTADPTSLGEVAFVLILAAIAVPAARYAGGVRRGVPGSWPHLAGLAALLACALVETAVAADLLEAPYVMDLGFLAATLTIGAELVRRVAGDARSLAELNGRLEEAVARRSAELARAQAALARSERLAALGRLAAGVAHQVNSPLAAIAANSAWVRQELAAGSAPGAGGEVGEAVQEIGEAARRIHGVVMDLKVFALRRDAGPEATHVRPVLDSAIRLVGHTLARPGAVVVEDQDPPPVGALPAQLAQLLVSLLEHAIRPGPAGVALPIAVRTRGQDGQVLVEIEDRGPALPPGGKPGPELLLAAGMARELGGRLELEGGAEGARARLWLPVAEA